MTNSRQSGCRRSFVATLFLAVILFVFYQFRLNEIAKTDSISQLELRVDSLVRQLRRLEDVISIQGYVTDKNEWVIYHFSSSHLSMDCYMFIHFLASTCLLINISTKWELVVLLT